MIIMIDDDHDDDRDNNDDNIENDDDNIHLN